MNDFSSSRLLTELAGEEADAICARYKISRDEAVALLIQEWLSIPELASGAAAMDGARLRRLRVYREAVKRVKKRIYFGLRRYKSAPELFERLVEELERTVREGSADDAGRRVMAELLDLHASTRERRDIMVEVGAFVSPWLRSGSSILDLGCGLWPLQAASFLPACPYLALDRDALCIRAVTAGAGLLAMPQLHARQWDLTSEPDEWEDVRDQWDLVIMLKLIPVLARVAPAVLDHIAALPAGRWLLSANATALTRRTDIERRERTVVRQFIERSGRMVTAEARCGDELFWVAEMES
ncbi:hypothetical protein JW905_05880 [bacterium]|nr:hypothetical protein [candidate division CSSED10-310 bacterium]